MDAIAFRRLRHDQVVVAIGVEIAGSDVDAAIECRIVGEKAAQFGFLVLAAEHADVWPATWTGRENEVGIAVGIDIAGADVDAAEEVGREGKEFGDEPERLTVEHANVWPAAGPCPGDDICISIAIEIAD